MTSLSRRTALKLLAAGTGLPTGAASGAQADSLELKPVGRWSSTHSRVFTGGEFWANPMEDWRIVDGAAECQTTGGNRNIHLLTHQLTDAGKSFAMSVRVQQLEVRRVDGGAGFRIGIRSELNEYRSNLFARGGIRAGIAEGSLVLAGKSRRIDGDATDVVLELTGRPAGEQYRLAIVARTPQSGEALGELAVDVPAENVPGNVAVVSNFVPTIKKGQGARYRFRDWQVGGPAFTVDDSRRFGPLLWTMYTLSDSRSDEGFVLKLSALTAPLGDEDDHQVELQVNRNGEWSSLGHAELDPDAWTATFRIPHWDATRSVPYRVVYREKQTDGGVIESDWSGTIRENPTDRPLRLAALTCQNDYGFPYEPVVQNLIRLDPDMLYFSGDQLYEGHGGYGLIRDPAEPAILNYLRKFYQFGLSFRDALRNAPTVCIPDDHDVFQGNIWGEGGMKMAEGSTSSKGGYREPARMVNVVHRTCAGHHPDYFDPTPCQQGISVYYGDMVYGGVSFAILGDRQWKSGPEHVETGSGRADHVRDPEFDTSVLDKPGLKLLGERQEEFLEHWASDWRGHSMKVLLSQTVFAGVATHHGGYDGYLKADLDSGGWPQTARNRAVRILRKSKALHINGDQHLTTLIQYGVDRQRDSNWSFCTPAIAAGYPRWWRPDEIGMEHANRPRHGLDHTGEFLDGFGNRAYVYAVGNPVVGRDRNRYRKAHEKGSGFGMVTIDGQARTYHIESFRFLVDATDGNPGNQFPGWPVTIHQDENAGENRLA